MHHTKNRSSCVYTKSLTSRFYTYLGCTPHIAVLRTFSPAGGCAITILKASKGQKSGQSLVKLVFDVEDVEAFKQASAEQGLHFGVTHRGEGYAFANASDPARNLVQISSRRVTKHTQ